MESICNNWEFTPHWQEGFELGEGEYERIRIPHTVKEIPLHYANHESYQTVCGYRRKIVCPGRGKRAFIRFEGAAHIAEVFLNGEKLMTHRCGYTAFSAELTGKAREGENLIAVRLDTTENPEIPPFGFVIDYLTYGGIYRPVWLDITEEEYIKDVFVRTPETDTVRVTTETDGGGRVSVSISDEGQVIASDEGHDCTIRVPGAAVWSLDDPKRYKCTVTLEKDGTVKDKKEIMFGFRTARFSEDGFYLNGEKIFLRGLNRHQDFPYMGYAAPESLQREDARILKYELGCNAVRTSHYPQSRYFIDECDKIGLAVFCEIPGWQHIGGEEWKRQAIENTREMVREFRNHPSIVLWGVRINESMDDDGFYSRTNAAAHSLDESRQTSGVRYITRSSLLEDVYAFNDFSYDGSGAGSLDRERITGSIEAPYFISEHNGHMFPTKSFDNRERLEEQALRHAEVQRCAMVNGAAGCFGWCMADYPTHRDFGSGDRVCWHGVTDRFRNPKAAAYFYRSQSDEEPVLYITSSMDVGEYPAGRMRSVYALTNADSVRLFKNGRFVREFRPEGDGLRHPPVEINDTVGILLLSEEGFSSETADAVKSCLFALRDHGETRLPFLEKLKLVWCFAKYGVTKEKMGELFTKYINSWSTSPVEWRFEGVKDGKTFATVIKKPSTRLVIQAIPGKTELCEGDTFDMTSVRVRITDENGNLAPYAQYPVHFSISGEGELVGPDTVTAEGGMCGTYVRTVGAAGKIVLVISTDVTEDVKTEFTVSAENETERKESSQK